ncbi:hypothetical protein [Anaeromyxobacter dehalogenans]|uniref:Uncharacterized protein n=1 Tax=Anaeromyxobacter dehalogenans (strain 2CP-C) TaxID=290397 RepID=Q2IKB2_ANADE|nr:hypothetical protein [Anaeromyxobacter dehalogenans]ABC82092.1 hypothetical protein Adeh_2322 [Anaeromyxobacter dehalogenans 2CP-C]
MDAKRLMELRKLAEQAVADMPAGELKVKAFEVMLAHLLAGEQRTTTSPGGEHAGRPTRNAEQRKEANSLIGRLLVLRGEGLFRNQRAMGEIREELQAHGWHYPLTTLSGALVTLTRRGELRRQRVAQGERKIWKYSNP